MMGPILQRPVARALQVVLESCGVALLALFLAGFVQRNVTHQGDLKTYLLAGRAVLEGLDPYRPESLSELAGRRVPPFVYPPVTLLPCVAAVALPPKLVAAAWMWGKIAVLGALVLAWSGWFVRGASLLAVALVAVFGWNSSAQWDLAAGNVAILECALVWAAFGCYLAGWRWRFALLVLAAASFKLMPAAFLLLLLVPTGRASGSPGRFAGALVLLGLVVLGPMVVGPASRFEPFWSHLPDATDHGASNPSALGLARVVTGAIGLEGAVAGRVALGLWLAYLAGVVACSVPLLRRAHRDRDARRWVMTAVLLYVLLLPRPMAYGFALLAPVPFYFAPRPFHRPGGQLVLALVLAAQGLWRLTSIGLGSPLAVYAPLLLSLCVWGLVVGGGSGAGRGAEIREMAGEANLPAPAAEAA